MGLNISSSHGVGAWKPPKQSNAWYIPVTGRTSGTPTSGVLVMSATENFTPTVLGSATVAVARVADSTFIKHTLTINCPNNTSGYVVIPDKTKLVSLSIHGGAVDPGSDMYTGVDATAPIVTINLDHAGSTIQKIRQNTAYATILPIIGTKPMPSVMTYFRLVGANIKWVSSGPLPTGLTMLLLNGANIAWEYDGPLPSGLKYIRLESPFINWTSLDLSGTGNLATFSLYNFRSEKLTSPQMVTVLTSLTNRVGTLPTSINIYDYADYASPPVSVTNAVTLLKSTKGITTVNFGV